MQVLIALKLLYMEVPTRVDDLGGSGLQSAPAIPIAGSPPVGVQSGSSREMLLSCAGQSPEERTSW